MAKLLLLLSLFLVLNVYVIIVILMSGACLTLQTSVSFLPYDTLIRTYRLSAQWPTSCSLLNDTLAPYIGYASTLILKQVNINRFEVKVDTTFFVQVNIIKPYLNQTKL